MVTTLDTLSKGEKATIIKINGNLIPYYLGFVPGATVSVIHVAPFGCPRSVSINGGNAFSLRNKVLRDVIVKIENPE